MAKKKKAASIGSVEEQIAKEFGADIMVTGNVIVDKAVQTIPVSPAIDIMLGGGIQEGSFVIPTGPPKVGKTSLSLDFAATAMDYPCTLCDEREIYFFNIEGRIKTRDLLGIHHLRPYINNRLHIIRSVPGNILTAENYIDMGERLINEKPGCIFIFDSFSSLCTKSRRDGAIGDRFRDDTPLLLANFCKRISNVVPVNNSIVIGITHLIANQGHGMSPWVEASGRKVQYAVDVKLKATHDTPWKLSSSDDAAQIGQDIHWQCFSSSIGPKGTKCTSKFRYGWGIDKEAELILACVDLGLIKKAGSWYSVGEKKSQGLEGIRSMLVESPELYVELNQKLREMLDLPLCSLQA